MSEIPRGNLWATLGSILPWQNTVILSGQLSQDTLHHYTFPIQPHESVE